MALDFRISMHRNSDNLHLKLLGDFDGSSACQLLDVLRKYSHGSHKIIIHTSCLTDICAFGRETFRCNLSGLKGGCSRILFTGDNASQLAPERTNLSCDYIPLDIQSRKRPCLGHVEPLPPRFREVQ